MKSQTIDPKKIVVPDYVERVADKISDARDMASIKEHGVEHDLVLIRKGDQWILCDGERRRRFAIALGLRTVPFIEATVPEGYTPEEYGAELRLALDIHTEPLRPSQKCAFFIELKERFGMSSKQLAAHLGIDADTVTNVTAVRNYIPEVTAALDAGQMSMGAARVFDGMTEKGQQHVWKRHSEDIEGKGKAKMHKLVRAMYPPEEKPDFYRQPETVAKRLAHKKQKRKGRAALPTITHAEKRRLTSSVDLKEIELAEGATEEKRLKMEIAAATVPIHAIMRNDKLHGMLTPEQVSEFEAFVEAY